MNLNLRQLRLLEATCRLGRLTEAADEQAISQSAASQAIRELERTLGYSLFHRVGRNLEPSDATQRILPRVREILSLVDTLEDPCGDQVRGDFHVAASVTIGCYLLPHLLAAFCRRHPQVEPRVTIGNSEAVIELLEKGRARLGIIEGPAGHTALEVHSWRKDTLSVFCAADHPLAGSGRIERKDLGQQRWIVREPGSGTRSVFDAAMRAARITPTIAFSLPRQEAIKQSVLAGLGVGCLSALSIADEVAAGQFVELATPLQLERELSWLVPPGRRRDTTLNAFLSLLE
ncbi:LysR family transcriptional regulator [Microbulbifer thermotolerans]|uniref:LysR family transcriptional regulator n=1 Tax=Microbulbifer thermotolerans TaxID=252514 RepID=A0A143HNN3_MICTH|nr:LysR family transcriptional regulator [Microbulbifer thermotolerans]AMX03344.1 LysR family transcriptional regulator [Microbulbifer thermotolerans]